MVKAKILTLLTERIIVKKRHRIIFSRKKKKFRTFTSDKPSILFNRNTGDNKKIYFPSFVKYRSSNRSSLTRLFTRAIKATPFVRLLPLASFPGT